MDQKNEGQESKIIARLSKFLHEELIMAWTKC